MRQVGFLVVFLGCAHNVPQDKNTGPDGKQKGALPVALQEGEGKAHGVVTYPGGDRVDWKLIELPAGQKGKLDLEMKYQTPRPGLQVAFDVFDQWNTPVIQASRPQGRVRMATIDNATGKYFVRIYAPKRGDAGTYDLVATFVATDDGKPAPPIVVPDPPKLPAVPPVEPDCLEFDPKIKACQVVCPEFGAPPGWKACADKDKAEKEAAAKEEAARVAAEIEKNKPKPAAARIIDVKLEGDDSKITIAYGTKAQPKLDNTWRVELINTKTGKPMQGIVTIIRIGETQILAKVKLPTDTVNQNLTVRLSPP
jgi:hypothetical protein